MDAAADAAVGAGDDVFFADELSERDYAMGCQFRMLDEVGGVADQVWELGFSRREFHVAPDFEVIQEKTPDSFSTRVLCGSGISNNLR